MTRTVVSIIVAVLLLVGGWIGYEKYQDWRRAQRTEATVKRDEHGNVVVAEKDTIGTKLPGVATADSTITRTVGTTPTKPIIRWIHDTVPGSVDSAAYVPRASYDTLWTAFADLRTAAIAYRDSSRALLVRFPRLVAAQDSVIKYQRILIDTPKPRRNLGFGISAGYGVALIDNAVKVAPSVHVGFSYSF